MAGFRLCRRVWLLLALCCATAPAAAEERGESRGSTYTQTHRNSTYECAPSGPCLICSSAERQSGDMFQCSDTNYHQAYKCTEIFASKVGSRKDASIQDRQTAEGERSRKHGPSDERLAQPDHRLNTESASTYPAAADVYYIYNTCLPAAQEESLSVLGFEMIMLAVLVVCGPVVHYRKKKLYSANGMTRVPTSARF